MAKLLILTLSTGEAALPVQQEQLASQTFQDFEHEIIAGLGNKEAHDRLYRTIMDRAAIHQFFMKLDADMTFRRPSAVEEAIAAAASRPDGQHFVFPIHDFFTDEETLAVHLFRSGVRWRTITDTLFVDPDPPDVKQVIWRGAPAPFVNHGEVVSDLECFSFGVHKFLKVAQRDRDPAGTGPPPKAHKFHRHMKNCARIRDLYRQTGARRHFLALAGIVWTMSHPEVAVLESKAALAALFASEIQAREAEWRRRVDRIADSYIAWRLALVRSLGVRRAFGRM
jgi:hypothetical protein